MLNPHRPGADDHEAQTVRSLRALLALGVAAALFVAVAFSAIESPPEPPLATQAPESPPATDTTTPGA